MFHFGYIKLLVYNKKLKHDDLSLLTQIFDETHQRNRTWADRVRWGRTVLSVLSIRVSALRWPYVCWPRSHQPQVLRRLTRKLATRLTLAGTVPFAQHAFVDGEGACARVEY
jgi:hypothetical protein